MKTKKKTLKKFKVILKNLKKVINFKRLIFIIVLLAGNTFAWFIYSREVSNSIDVHVRAWKILFESGDSAIEDYFEVNVDEIYPGMNEYTSELVAHNRSDVAARLTYSILSARIFDTEYVTIEGKQDNNEEILETDINSIELERILAEDFPFTIDIDISTVELDREYGEATYTVRVNWPYESGDDELDTYWGNKAYEFTEENPGVSCIEMSIKVYITQAPSESSSGD